MPAPLSIVIPALNAAETLGPTLSALVPGAVAGLVREVIVVDGGSTDGTARIADAAGARVIESEKGRGQQLGAGARAATGEWLLFVHADTILEPGWVEETDRFMEACARQGRDQAAAFTFALDDFDAQARRLERMVSWRCRVLRLPYGDQGLLLPRRFYEALGGFADMPLMEDVDLVRRIGRARLSMLSTRAVTSAVRFRREGYWLRPARNLALVGLFYLRVPPRILARLYG